MLRMHLTSFLATALAHDPVALSTYLSDEAVDRILETRELGAGLGTSLELEKALRWREVVRPGAGEWLSVDTY